MPVRTPLRARTTGVLEREGYRVEKVVFESMPHLYVTANLYLPSTREACFPWFCTCADTIRLRPALNMDISTTAFGWRSMVSAALLVDTIEFAEIAGIHHGPLQP